MLVDSHCHLDFLCKNGNDINIFIENAKNSDNPKTVKRVNTLIEQNIYGLNLKK